MIFSSLEDDIRKVSKTRETIQTAIENFDLNDILKVFIGYTIQFTWHSSSKPYIFFQDLNNF